LTEKILLNGCQLQIRIHGQLSYIDIWVDPNSRIYCGKISLEVEIYFFLGINSESLLIKIPRYTGGVNGYLVVVHQSLRLQSSSMSKKLEHGIELKKELQSSKDWRRKDLISRIHCSLPLMHNVPQPSINIFLYLISFPLFTSCALGCSFLSIYLITYQKKKKIPVHIQK